VFSPVAFNLADSQAYQYGIAPADYQITVSIPDSSTIVYAFFAANDRDLNSMSNVFFVQGGAGQDKMLYNPYLTSTVYNKLKPYKFNSLTLSGKSQYSSSQYISTTTVQVLASPMIRSIAPVQLFEKGISSSSCSNSATRIKPGLCTPASTMALCFVETVAFARSRPGRIASMAHRLFDWGSVVSVARIAQTYV